MKNLKVESKTERYHQFLDNWNIKVDNLCRDGLHLGESSKNLLLENYVKNFLLDFYRTRSSSNLNKKRKFIRHNSGRPNNIDQMWKLKNVRIKNSNNVIIGNININSLPGKFVQLKCLISNYVDMLVLTEAKLDETFTTSSFLIDGFSSPFQLNRNWKGGGILVYVINFIPNKLLTKGSFPNGIEGLLVEKQMDTFQNISPTLKKRLTLFWISWQSSRSL